MDEGDALQFYEDVVGGENHVDERREFVLTAANNREQTVYLTKLDRKYIIDQLNKLPDEMLEMFSEAEDPEDIDEEEAASTMSSLTGDAIEAFEKSCVESMDHPDLTEHHFEGMVEELNLEVLFEMGSRVMELSLDEGGKITGFREQS